MKSSNLLTILSIALCSILTISCNKHGNEVISPKTDPYIGDLVHTGSTVTSVKVYARSGEVTDPSLVAAALETTGLNSIGMAKAGPAIPNRYVRFFNAKVFILEPGGSDFYNVVKNDSLFVFSHGYDSTFETVAGVAATGYLGYLANNFYKYPLYTPVPNNSAMMIKKRRFSGYGSYNAINLRGLDFHILRRDSVTKAIVTKFFTIGYNEFDESSVKYLGRYDTIAIRNYTMNFAKK